MQAAAGEGPARQSHVERVRRQAALKLLLFEGRLAVVLGLRQFRLEAIDRLAEGGAEAVGPILLGMAKPVHLLARGAEVEEIVNMTTIAVVDAQECTEPTGARVALAAAAVG